MPSRNKQATSPISLQNIYDYSTSSNDVNDILKSFDLDEDNDYLSSSPQNYDNKGSTFPLLQFGFDQDDLNYINGTGDSFYLDEDDNDDYDPEKEPDDGPEDADVPFLV